MKKSFRIHPTKIPVNNSLFVDIGAGTTDFCIIQGYFPKPQDLLSIPFGGNEVDVILDQLIRESYPEVNLPISMIRGFKEDFSYVGEPESGLRVKVPVEGNRGRLRLVSRLVRLAIGWLMKLLTL